MRRVLGRAMRNTADLMLGRGFATWKRHAVTAGALHKQSLVWTVSGGSFACGTCAYMGGYVFRLRSPHVASVCVQCLRLGQHCILQLHAHVSPMGHPPCVTSPVPSHVVVTGRQNSFRSLEGVAARTSTALERLADAFSSRNVKRRVLGRWARAARDRKTARSLVKRWCARLAVWLLPRCCAVVAPITGDVHSICYLLLLPGCTRACLSISASGGKLCTRPRFLGTETKRCTRARAMLSCRYATGLVYVASSPPLELKWVWVPARNIPLFFIGILRGLCGMCTTAQLCRPPTPRCTPRCLSESRPWSRRPVP